MGVCALTRIKRPRLCPDHDIPEPDQNTAERSMRPIAVGTFGHAAKADGAITCSLP